MTLELFADALHAWYVVGWSELIFRRFDAAIQAFERAVAISPDALSIGYLGHAHAGRRDIAISLVHELLSRIERSYVPPKSLICLYAGLGHRNRVVEWLEKVYEDRDPLLFFLQAPAVRIFGPLADLIDAWSRKRLPHL